MQQTICQALILENRFSCCGEKEFVFDWLGSLFSETIRSSMMLARGADGLK